MNWSQDFRYYSNNIPYGVMFTLDKILDRDRKRVVLRGKNYGNMKKNGYFSTSRYGNGSIFCDLNEILPYMMR